MENATTDSSGDVEASVNIDSNLKKNKHIMYFVLENHGDIMVRSCRFDLLSPGFTHSPCEKKERERRGVIEPGKCKLLILVVMRQ